MMTRSGPSGLPDDAEHTFVLVAIDGVRRDEVFRGVEVERARDQGFESSEILTARELTPNLHALMDSGAFVGEPHHGIGISASGPEYMSVPGYMEMFTGRRPTGCTTNNCNPTTYRTLADDFVRQPGVGPMDVAVIASWEGVGRAASSDPSRITISVGRTQGETRDLLRYDSDASALLDVGEHAGPEPGEGDFRRDRVTAAIALRYLHHFRPRFAFVGLGETDEYAHHDDYRGYLRALSFADNVVGQIAAILSRYEREGRRTTLLITTDHGRAENFTGHGNGSLESHVWLIANGSGVDARGPVFTPVPRHLADVAATVRAWAGLGTIHPSSRVIDELAPIDTRVSSHP